MIPTPIRIANHLVTPLRVDVDPYAEHYLHLERNPNIIELNTLKDVFDLISELNRMRTEAENRYKAEQLNKAALLEESIRTVNHIMYHSGYPEEARIFTTERIRKSAYTHRVP